MSLRKFLILVPLLGMAGVGASAPGIGSKQITPLEQNISINKDLIRQIDRPQLEELRRKDIVSKLGFCPGNNLNLCFVPTPTNAADIDVNRSLFVHDEATLTGKDFSLARTLEQLATQVVVQAPGTSGVSIFRQLWDTQNPTPGVTGVSNPHCNDSCGGATGIPCVDSGGNAQGAVNGFPYKCRAAEGNEAQGNDQQIKDKIATYKPIALINRMDLAHQGWRNCGEYRIIYGKQGGPGRNFVIFEAVLPNPKPGCREGCLPVAEFWKSLSTMNNPVDRATALESFYYTGLPGFRKVVHVDHYSATGAGSTYGSSGSGQIRTNQFMQGPWTLKEFKTVLDCGTTPCKFQIVPVMVKVNPQGELWNEDVAHTAGFMQARAAVFQPDMVAQIPSLANNDLMGIGYSVALDHDAAQSDAQNNLPDDFFTQFGNATGAVNTFRSNFSLDANSHVDATGTPLNAEKIINRAITQDCGGCHQPGTFGLSAADSIGSVHAPDGSIVNRWPNSLGFVHVSENVSALPELTGAAFPSSNGHAISQALRDNFVPARKQFLLAQLNRIRCTCRRCFRFPIKATLTNAMTIQDKLDKQFAPRLEALTKKRQQLKGAEADKLTSELTTLLAERDAKLAQELKAQKIEIVHEDLRPASVKLTAAKLAKGDLKKEKQLRQEQVLEILKQEPPRKTVTGSFRSH